MSLIRKNVPLTHNRLKEVLSYDAASGAFLWKVSVKRVKEGDRAGCVKPNGNRYINIDGHTYVAQRLAWFFVHAKWPGQLRFKNSDADDCRIDNLMECFALSEKYDHQVAADRKAYRQAYWKARGAEHNARTRQYKYGVSPEKYGQMVLAQNGLCQICSRPETGVRNGKLKALAVDHCHKTGSIRDLLCQSCNGLLGMASDNIEILQSAIKYLRKHSSQDSNVVPMKLVANTENVS